MSDSTHNQTNKKDRRFLDWSRIKKPRESIALVIGTAGGAGLLPLAPGTWGSVVGLVLAAGSFYWPLALRLAMWTFLFLIGCWACKVVDETMGTADNQNLVIDEVVGMGITAWYVDLSPLSLLVAFVLFRAFDMIKPPPIRQIDQWSHARGSLWWQGFGVMADDVMAGVFGLVVFLGIRWLGWITI